MADQAIRRTRSVSIEDQSVSNQIDGGCQAISEDDWKNVDEHARTTRNAESGSVFRINESFVKVLVIADRSMVKFHTHLSDYILTLMSHVSTNNVYRRARNRFCFCPDNTTTNKIEKEYYFLTYW